MRYILIFTILILLSGCTSSVDLVLVEPELDNQVVVELIQIEQPDVSEVCSLKCDNPDCDDPECNGIICDCNECQEEGDTSCEE